MIAYKGFSKDVTSLMGNGIKEKCTFELGKTYREKESKTVRSGFHCCENPFECLSYYAFNGENRYFKVDASGDIDEDDGERIACTEITLLEELSPIKYALEGMKYMVEHQDRKKWEQNHINVVVCKDSATAEQKESIAIARGKCPKVKGPEGSILGLIVEDKYGIKNCKLFIAKKELAGKWCRLTDNRKIVEVPDEEKTC